MAWHCVVQCVAAIGDVPCWGRYASGSTFHQSVALDRGMGRRDVIPWRPGGRCDRDLGVCRNNKLALLPVADLVAVVTPVGRFFGRLVNFINGELWGKAIRRLLGHDDRAECFERRLDGFLQLCEFPAELP